MSNYKNFIQDFPSRCIDLLETHIKQAEDDDREVTLMLMIATAAFTIPFERLRSQPGEHLANDVTRYTIAKRKFNNLLNTKFFAFHPDGKDKSWRIVRALNVNLDEIQTDPTSYWKNQADKQELLNDIDVNPVFSSLRNALAHGNIFTLPLDDSSRSEIGKIVFVSRRYGRGECQCEECGETVERRMPLDSYNVLFVSPEDLLNFIRVWMKFLNGLDLGSSALSPGIAPSIY